MQTWCVCRRRIATLFLCAVSAVVRLNVIAMDIQKNSSLVLTVATVVREQITN